MRSSRRFKRASVTSSWACRSAMRRSWISDSVRRASTVLTSSENVSEVIPGAPGSPGSPRSPRSPLGPRTPVMVPLRVDDFAILYRLTRLSTMCQLWSWNRRRSSLRFPRYSWQMSQLTMGHHRSADLRSKREREAHVVSPRDRIYSTEQKPPAPPYPHRFDSTVTRIRARE